MLRKLIRGLLLGAALAIPIHTPAHASGSPDLGFADFEANPETLLNYPAHYSLELDGLATIEFLVRPEWIEVPDFDPVILSALGSTGARYGILMTREQDGIGLFSGNDWDYIPFDFTDGKSHHVAFIMQGDLTDVYVDGEFQGGLDQGVAEDVGVTTFHIGSLDGANNLFKGQLGVLRIWDTAVDPDDLEVFQTKSILNTSETTHPDLELLVAYSEFADGARKFVLTDANLTFDELIEDLSIALDETSEVVAEPADDGGVETDTLIEGLTPDEAAIFNDDLDSLLEDDIEENAETQVGTKINRSLTSPSGDDETSLTPTHEPASEEAPIQKAEPADNDLNGDGE